MTRFQVGEIVLAHHAILASVPFLMPTLIITGTILVMIIQDRRRPLDA